MSTVQADPPATYYGLAQAAKFYPQTNGRPPHPSTLTRHILRGVRLNDGTTLKLRAKRTPGGWHVSREAVDEFIDRLTADRCGTPAPPRTPDPRVEAALDAAGF